MSKFIDADRLLAEIEKERKKTLDATKRGGLTLSDIETADALAEVLLIIEQLKKEQPEAVEYEVGMHGEPIKITLDKYVQRARGIFPGDKVKIIIVKED